MKLFQILTVYLLAFIVGAIALFALSATFPNQPGCLGLIVGAIVIVPTVIIANRIAHK